MLNNSEFVKVSNAFNVVKELKGIPSLYPAKVRKGIPSLYPAKVRKGIPSLFSAKVRKLFQGTLFSKWMSKLTFLFTILFLVLSTFQLPLFFSEKVRKLFQGTSFSKWMSKITFLFTILFLVPLAVQVPSFNFPSLSFEGIVKGASEYLHQLCITLIKQISI